MDRDEEALIRIYNTEEIFATLPSIEDPDIEAMLLDPEVRRCVEERALDRLRPKLKSARKEARALARDMLGAIVRRDGGGCFHCGDVLRPGAIHIDHLVPLTKNGGAELENLVASCAHCNLEKAAKL